MATISLCMIARNEEKFIAAAINSVRNFVDEIIVVDTGSIDNTAELCRQLGASVFHFKWVDDFSAARNFAVSKASSDWVLILDADEEIHPLEVPKLKQLSDLQCDAVVFTQKNFSNTPGFGFVTQPSRGFKGFFPSFITRMFRNGRGIVFEGPVHESVDSSLKKIGAKAAFTPEVSINHYQELKGEQYLREKQLKYAVIIEKNLDRIPNKSKAYADLGIICYRYKQDYASAAKWFNKSLEIEPNNAFVINDLAATHIALNDYKAAIDCFGRSISIRPEASTFYNIGLLQERLGDKEAASIAYSEAARLGHARAGELVERAKALHGGNKK